MNRFSGTAYNPLLTVCYVILLSIQRLLNAYGFSMVQDSVMQVHLLPDKRERGIPALLSLSACATHYTTQAVAFPHLGEYATY